MKTYLALLICCVSLASCSSGASHVAVEPSEYQWEEFSFLELDKLKVIISDRWDNAQAEARAMEDCGLTHWEGTTIEWTGGCVAGKRDGHGVLSWIKEHNITRGQGPRKVQLMTWRFEGRFVKGQRLGLWCKTVTWRRTRDGQFVSDGSLGGCSILGGSAKPLTGEYRKEPDGSWMEYRLESPTGQSLAAGALEAQGAKVLADVAAGKTDLKVDLRIQNRSLDDLVRDSKIVLALSAAPISLMDKRVAIVLSSQTVSELERFTRERQALVDASAGLRGEAAVERAKFIQASDPGRLLIKILNVVRRNAKEAQLAEDLAGLKDNSFDYALVVDWKSLTRFDQLGKYDSFPIPAKGAEALSLIEAFVLNGTVTPLIGESLSGFLISRDLKAVKQFQAVMDVFTRPQPVEYPVGYPVEDIPTGDQDYFKWLALYFEHRWGNGTNYLSMPMNILEFFLKP